MHESGTLIHPPAGFDHFDGFNTWVHGINAEMVADAPRWRQVRDWIVDYIGPDILVCHNAGFDVGVLRHACTADQMPWPHVDFLCTLVLARRAFRLPSYRLPFVAAECDVSLVSHHQASDDARCAALIAVAMARKQGADTLAELAGSFDVRIGHLEEAATRPARGAAMAMAVRTTWSGRMPTLTQTQTTRITDAFSCSPGRYGHEPGKRHGKT